MAKTTPIKTVRLTRSGGTMWKVRINGQNVVFAGNTASKKMPPGDHTIQFFVRGTNLSSYSLDITAPPEAKLAFAGTFNQLQKDQGNGWFTVN